MAEFRKLETQRGGAAWYLILENEHDVLMYMDIDSTLMVDEIVNVASQKREFKTVGHANSTVGVIAHSLIDLYEASSKSAPDFLSDITQKKGIAMLNIIRKGCTVSINHNRGYNDFEGFDAIHNFKVLATLPAQSPFAFPKDDSIDVPLVDHLILENAPRDNREIIQRFKLESQKHACITSLKEQSSEFVMIAIEYASDIYFSTQAIDAQQVDKMMTLFESLILRKTIHIVITTHDAKRIKKHPQFFKVAAQHIVHFYKPTIHRLV